MGLTEINIRERDFHNKLQSKEKGRFENIFYKAIFNANRDFFEYLKNNAKDSKILDYGCGIGTFVEKIAKFAPKKIFGIDISEVSIEKAKKNAMELKLEAEYSVDNCENTQFEKNSFDIVYGTGILHHLQLDKCLNEIHRILKPEGNLVFIEPLGTNPLINLYRKFTPKSRSKDEHPLLKKDFKNLDSKFETNVKYYGFLTLIFLPFYGSPANSRLFKFLAYTDQFLFKFKLFKVFAWSCLIIAKKR